MISSSSTRRLAQFPGSVHLRLCGSKSMHEPANTGCGNSDDKVAKPYCSRTCLMSSEYTQSVSSRVEHDPEWHLVSWVASPIRETLALFGTSSELFLGPHMESALAIAAPAILPSPSFVPLFTAEGDEGAPVVVPDSSFSPVLCRHGRTGPLLTGSTWDGR